MEKERDIPTKKFVGVLLILIPIIFWITQYIRYECVGGHCKVSLEWILAGFAGVLLGLVLLLTSGEKKDFNIHPPEPPAKE